MRSGTLTLSNGKVTEITADVQPEFLVFIILEAIRNALYVKRESALLPHYDAVMSSYTTSEDVYGGSVDYLMEVVASNDPDYDPEDLEAVMELQLAIMDKLTLVITEVDINNPHEILMNYDHLLFDPDGVFLYPSVVGTFVGSKAILCFP